MKIEDIHKENFKLIAEHSIYDGTRLMPKGNVLGPFVTVKYIHGLYGWIICDDTNVPQRASSLLEKYDVLTN